MNSEISASGDNEAIDDNSLEQAPDEVVVEPDPAWLEAPNGARPDTPFHTTGFVPATYVLGLRALIRHSNLRPTPDAMSPAPAKPGSSSSGPSTLP